MTAPAGSGPGLSRMIKAVFSDVSVRRTISLITEREVVSPDLARGRAQ